MIIKSIIKNWWSVFQIM